MRRPKLTPEEILALRGTGWDGDLEALNTSRRFDLDGADAEPA
jgi:hypothetical protein